MATQIRPYTYTVEYRDTFLDTWTTATDVDLENVNFRAAPQIQSAVLFRRRSAKHESGTRSVVGALDLAGKLIRITLTEYSTDDSGTTHQWYGYCTKPTDTVDGTNSLRIAGVDTDIYTGTTTYQCFGLEFFLRQQVVTRSKLASGDMIETSLPFNRKVRVGSKRGGKYTTVGYRSAAKSTSVGSPDGFYTFDSTQTAEWTALDAAEHLLELFYQTFGMAFSLTGQHSYLANVQGSWEFEGASYYDALVQLINPRSGFTFCVKSTDIEVVSVSDVALADGKIPANDNVVSLNLDSSQALRRPTVQHVETSHFDRVVVRGAPLRVCFTMADDYGTLAKGWTTAQETAYNALATDDLDKEEHQHIFSRLVLPTGWNQEADGQNCMPIIDEATGLVDTASKQPYFEPAQVLDRALPIEDTAGEYRKPLVIIHDTDASKYRRIDKPGDSLKATGAKVLDNATGIQLRSPYPGYYGKNHYSGADTRALQFDWQKIHATVSMYTPDRVRIVKTFTEPGPVTKEKVIDVPDAHLWYVVPDTVNDVTEGGLTLHAGGYVRNDTARLQRIADLAEAWYGRRRTVISIPYSEDAIVDRLGHVIKETLASGTNTPTGTMVTEVSYDVRGRTTTLRTEFFDLDVKQVAGVSASMFAESIARRLDYVEENLANVPVITPSGEGGGGGAVPVKVTASTAYNRYTVDVHANGEDEAATATGATLHILQIATSETIPNNTWLMASKIGDNYRGQVPVLI